ncbi:hypothetical protein [Zavarzinella formosa]|uniref:hypothetical protein n=1 Tax=Zavarzinella formosa TaxID=360055 RepID=UPI000364C7C5|nr:hypothetical protein [Zavarzinella formosa]
MPDTATTNLSISTPPPRPHADAKWVAVVNDTLVPLPRRLLLARDVLAQAGLRGTLVRDYNQQTDLPLDPSVEIDLAGGNVFLTTEVCEAPVLERHPDAQPKLAFVVDDAWEMTTNPRQTLESLRGLFQILENLDVLRDLESPHDELIRRGEPIQFADGPVFRTQKTVITITVNNRSVRFSKRWVTGLEIKTTAIEQGVEVDVGCVLYPQKPGGGRGSAIADAAVVELRQCDVFKCIAPDDNS